MNTEKVDAMVDLMKALGYGQNAVGAIPIGTTVYKTNSEPGDGNPDGTVAIVRGSLKVPDEIAGHGSGRRIVYSYFVTYPNSEIPNVPVGIMDYKITTDAPNMA